MRLRASLKEGDVLALRATSKSFSRSQKTLTFGTDLFIEIPKNCVGYITSAESVNDTLLEFLNISALEHGWHEIEVVFGAGNRPKKNYEIGDIIGKLAVYRDRI